MNTTICSETGFIINVAPVVFVPKFAWDENNLVWDEYDLHSKNPIWGVEDAMIDMDLIHDLADLWPLIAKAFERDKEQKLSSIKADGKPVEIWFTLSEWKRLVWDHDEDGAYDTLIEGGKYLEVTLVRSPFDPKKFLLTRINKLLVH